MRRWLWMLLLTGFACAAPVGPDGEPVASTSQAVCSSTTLGSSVPSGTTPAGTPVTWTATAGCDSGDTPTYQFWLLAPGSGWIVAQAWSTSGTFAWDTTGDALGSYELQVWVRAQGSSASYESYGAAFFTLTAPQGGPCAGGSLTATPATPHAQGTPVTLQAGSSACISPEYQFWELAPGAGWIVARDWSMSSTFAWSTATAAVGDYEFQVWIKDQSSGATYDTYAAVFYTLTTASSNTPCTSGALSYSPPASQSYDDVVVTFTGSSSTCSAPQYEFWELPPGGSWIVTQPYSSSPTWVWDTNGVAGTYQIQVWIAQSGSSAPYDTYAAATYLLQAGSQTCNALTLTVSPPSPQPVGTTVTLQGAETPSGCQTGWFEYWELPPGGAWTSVQYAPNEPAYTWNTATSVPGTYEFQLWVTAGDDPGGADPQFYRALSYALTVGGGAGDAGAGDASAGDASEGGGPCDLTVCGSQCVDTSTDSNNCGGCGVVCSATAPSTVTCAAGRCLTTLATTQVQGNFADLAVDSTSVYVTVGQESGSIGKIPLGGGTLAALPMSNDAGAQPLYGMSGIAVDSTSIYFVSAAPVGGGFIGKTSLNGGAFEVLAPSAGEVFPLLVDGTSVYWASGAAPYAIMKVPLNGGSAVVLATTSNQAGGLAIDSSWAYWGTFPPTGLMRTSLSGGATTTLSPTGDQQSIAVNATTIYYGDDAIAGSPYSNGGTDGLYSLPLAGGSPTLMIGEYPGRLVLDDQYVYWIDGGVGLVAKTPLGGGATTLLATGRAGPVHIAVDATSVYWIETSALMKITPK